MIPRARRFPLRPYTRPHDPCAVAAAGMRVFGKRYAKIAHLLDKNALLELDNAIRNDPRDAIRARLYLPSALIPYDLTAAAITYTAPSRPLPVSQGEQQHDNNIPAS